MPIIFDYEETDEVLKEEIEEIKKKISKLDNEIFMNKISRYTNFLLDENKIGHYVEIHLPIFDLDITILISIIKRKFLISIVDHADGKVYGNLLINGYPCIKVKELKELGSWSNYSENKLSIFKPLE